MTDSIATHFREAGWGIYIVLGLGVLGLAAAARFAWRGEHELLGFIRWMLLSVFAAGSFGFSLGMLNVFAYVVSVSEPDGRLVDLMTGLREASNNVALALMFVVLLSALTAVGYRRFPRPNPSAVPR